MKFMWCVAMVPQLASFGQRCLSVELEAEVVSTLETIAGLEDNLDKMQLVKASQLAQQLKSQWGLEVPQLQT